MIQVIISPLVYLHHKAIKIIKKQKNYNKREGHVMPPHEKIASHTDMLICKRLYYP